MAVFMKVFALDIRVADPGVKKALVRSTPIASIMNAPTTEALSNFMVLILDEEVSVDKRRGMNRVNNKNRKAFLPPQQ